jgi:hypothetical protein
MNIRKEIEKALSLSWDALPHCHPRDQPEGRIACQAVEKFLRGEASPDDCRDAMSTLRGDLISATGDPHRTAVAVIYFTCALAGTGDDFWVSFIAKADRQLKAMAD